MGKDGELVVRSPLAFRGYLSRVDGREVRGMDVDGDEWVRTDDVGSLHPGGLVKVYGRKSHVISRGIAIVYPIEVERIILQMSGVYKVCRMACVFHVIYCIYCRSF